MPREAVKEDSYYEIIQNLQRVPQLGSKEQVLGFSLRRFLSLLQGLQGGKSTPSESSQEAYERLLEKLQTLMISRTCTFSGSIWLKSSFAGFFTASESL